MPRTTIRLATSEDFTGGLNFRADPFQLEKNESPDLMNVDVDPRGGITLRKTFQRMNTTATPGAGVVSLFPYSTSSGINQILMKGMDGQIRYSTGANFTFTGYGRTLDHEAAVTFKDLLYTQDGVNGSVRWNGTAHVTLGQTFNDNYALPVGGHMPIAKHMASHQGMVFVANIKAQNEPGGIANGTQLRNRIRWSHPNFPEDWRSFDWIDIDIGREGDEITGLVPFGDRLLIFKRNSVHALYGYSKETFSVQPVTQDVGAVGPRAIVATEHAVYFFSWPGGVFRYNGRSVEWIFERLYPAMLDGNISATAASSIALGWGNRRLWVSVPWGTSTNSRTFVYDPTLGKSGCWVQYGQGFAHFFNWRPTGQTNVFLGAHPTLGWIVKLDQAGNQDNITGTPAEIDSYYTTAWHDLGEHAIMKRWKRPEFVVLSDISSRVRVEVFHDYNPSTIHNTFELETVLETSTDVWSNGAAGGKWGVAKWGRSSAGHNRVVKGGSLGLARSVQLKITGPSNPTRRWRINSVSLKYVPRRVRS